MSLNINIITYGSINEFSCCRLMMIIMRTT